jgi:hypothetical protein
MIEKEEHLELQQWEEVNGWEVLLEKLVFRMFDA